MLSKICLDLGNVPTPARDDACLVLGLRPRRASARSAVRRSRITPARWRNARGGGLREAEGAEPHKKVYTASVSAGSPLPAPRSAAMLVIGNEILTGKVDDANVVVLARALRGLGVELRRVVMILDDADVIATEVRMLSGSHEFLFTSGGVGPT